MKNCTLFRDILGRVQKMFVHEHVRVWTYRIFVVLISVFCVWLGLLAMHIAGGVRSGTVFTGLPQNFPLLLSGAFVIDRFSAVFLFILACWFLLSLLRFEGMKSLCSIFLQGVMVFGVVTASTPFTLVAWLFLLTAVHVRTCALKERMFFVYSMSALWLSILLLSGGAFLADMTVVATVSGQLPPVVVSLALLLLFGGVMGSARFFQGALFLVPAYICLRLCLFFFASTPAFVVSILALVAVLLALFYARSLTMRFLPFTYVLLAVMGFALTMLAITVQLITAVQCFLFGSIVLLAMAVLMDREERGAFRFLQSPLPGTFLGMGVVLLVGGYASLLRAVWGFGWEMMYVFFLLFCTAITIFFVLRTVFLTPSSMGTFRVFTVASVVRAGIFLGGAVFFAQMLAYLGTTIGGVTPDFSLSFVFETYTLTVIPTVLFAISVVVGILWNVCVRYASSYAEKIRVQRDRLCTWIDRHTFFQPSAHGVLFSLREYLSRVGIWCDAYEERQHFRGAVLYLVICFIITFTILL